MGETHGEDQQNRATLRGRICSVAHGYSHFVSSGQSWAVHECTQPQSFTISCLKACVDVLESLNYNLVERQSYRSTSMLSSCARSMFSDTKQRLWFWWFMHRWGIVRMRRHFVFALVLLSVLAAMIIIATTTPLFSSRATIRVEGMDSEGYVTNGLFSDEIQRLHQQHRPKPRGGAY